MPLIGCLVAVGIAMAAEWLIMVARLGGPTLPEMHPGYSTQALQAFLTNLGPLGRAWYARFQLADLLLIGGLSGAMIAIDRWALDRLGGGSLLRFIVLLPLAYAASDLAEDVALLGSIRGFGGSALQPGGIASALTWLKFLCLILSALATAVLGFKGVTAPRGRG